MSIDNATTEQWHRALDAANYADGWAKGGCPLDQLNHALDKPFGEVALWSRALAFALWQQGHPIEWRRADSLGDWRDGDPLWMPELCYRVLPKPEEIVLPSIDWSHVLTGLNWLTQDCNGVLFLSEKRPSPNERGRWEAEEFGWSMSADAFTSSKPGKGDWRKLIVQRPEGA